MTVLIYDAAEHGEHTAAGTRWRYAADTVMGGVSAGRAAVADVDGRRALLLEGEVSLENGGGFIQVNADLVAGGGDFDASGSGALELELLGDGGRFVILLKTRHLDRPWQSFRTELALPGRWATYRVALSAFEPHRTQARFDPRALRRIGLAALGRPGPARLAVSRVALVGAD